MADDDSSVSEFVAVTNSDAETAKFYLESCNGDISAAIESYFVNADATPPQMTNANESPPEPVAPSRPVVPSSRVRPPTRILIPDPRVCRLQDSVI